jgi:phosphoglucosamine mutase
MARLFGTDGVRGVANEELTPLLAMQLGQAGAYVLTKETNHKPTIMVGCDTRISGDMLANALMAGVCSVGANAVYVGVVPTPAVAYLVKECGYAAGVMISASHNPYSYNGIKIFGKDGFKIPQKCEKRIEEIIENEEFIEAINKGKTTVKKEEVKKYIDYLASNFKELLCGLRIGIDCANGSCVATAKELFNSLGAEIEYAYTNHHENQQKSHELCKYFERIAFHLVNFAVCIYAHTIPPSYGSSGYYNNSLLTA